MLSMGAAGKGVGKSSWRILEARERVETEGDDDAAAAFEFDKAARRERLEERLAAGPDDDDEGAAEEASARFRLRVSIQ